MQKKYLHRSEVIICSLKQCIIEYGFKPVKANMGQITPVCSGPRRKLFELESNFGLLVWNTFSNYLLRR